MYSLFESPPVLHNYLISLCNLSDGRRDNCEPPVKPAFFALVSIPEYVDVLTERPSGGSVRAFSQWAWILVHKWARLVAREHRDVNQRFDVPSPGKDDGVFENHPKADDSPAWTVALTASF